MNAVVDKLKDIQSKDTDPPSDLKDIVSATITDHERSCAEIANMRRIWADIGHGGVKSTPASAPRTQIMRPPAALAGGLACPAGSSASSASIVSTASSEIVLDVTSSRVWCGYRLLSDVLLTNASWGYATVLPKVEEARLELKLRLGPVLEQLQQGQHFHQDLKQQCDTLRTCLEQMDQIQDLIGEEMLNDYRQQQLKYGRPTYLVEPPVPMTR